MIAVLHFLKYNYIVGLTAGIIFFLIILGAIDGFSNPSLALIYLYGVLEAIVIGIAVALVSQIGLNRMGPACMNSLQAADWTARLTSNFVSYLIVGLNALLCSLILVLGMGP